MNLDYKPHLSALSLTAVLGLALAGMACTPQGEESESYGQEPPAETAPPPAQEPMPAPEPAPAPMPSTPAGQPAFADLDKNADGALTQDEIPAESALAQDFASADGDGDGKLSQAEFDAYAQR